MEQKNPNNLSSIPDFVVKVPRTSSSNQSVGSKNTFQVIVPQESNIELVTKQHFWRQSALPDTSVTNRSDAWHSPDIHIDYAQIDPPKPDWLHRLQDLPPIYGQVLMATTRSYGLDTDTIYRIFLSSGLDLRVLQHIWSLANRSHPGWLTPSELVMALALIALAQQDYFCLHQPTDSIITNLSVQRAYQCSAPPLPNVALPSPLDTLSYDNFTEHFRATDPNVPIQNPVHSSLNGVCNFQISNAACLRSSAPITTPQANDEDWADFTSCKPSGFGLPSWPAPSATVVSPVKFQLESNLMEDEQCPTAPHEDDFGEFQVGGSVKRILMPPGMPSNAAPSSKDPELQLGVGTLPNYNLSADFESYESPRDTVKYEWMRCLRQCSDVFVQSLDALTSLTSAADLEEFIGTAEARDFCLDVHLRISQTTLSLLVRRCCFCVFA
ncbi:unnamed protein product [Dicrocoelium dendriticum]|nr:unnamed protein product [Dicrocoelium dendriticum]